MHTDLKELHVTQILDRGTDVHDLTITGGARWSANVYWNRSALVDQPGP